MLLMIIIAVAIVSAQNLIVNPNFSGGCNKSKGDCIVDQTQSPDSLAPWQVQSCQTVTAATGCITGQFEQDFGIFPDGSILTNIDLNPNGPSSIAQTIQNLSAGFTQLSLSFDLGFNQKCKKLSGSMQVSILDSNGQDILAPQQFVGTMPWATKSIAVATTACGSLKVVFTSLEAGSCGPLLTNVMLVQSGTQDLTEVCQNGYSVPPVASPQTSRTSWSTTTMAPPSESFSTLTSAITSNSNPEQILPMKGQVGQFDAGKAIKIGIGAGAGVFAFTTLAFVLYRFNQRKNNQDSRSSTLSSDENIFTRIATTVVPK